MGVKGCSSSWNLVKSCRYKLVQRPYSLCNKIPDLQSEEPDVSSGGATFEEKRL
jgi:hypothetical protein